MAESCIKIQEIYQTKFLKWIFKNCPNSAFQSHELRNQLNLAKEKLRSNSHKIAWISISNYLVGNLEHLTDKIYFSKKILIKMTDRNYVGTTIRKIRLGIKFLYSDRASQRNAYSPQGCAWNKKTSKLNQKITKLKKKNTSRDL
jgi:hypothetical protein